MKKELKERQSKLKTDQAKNLWLLINMQLQKELPGS